MQINKRVTDAGEVLSRKEVQDAIALAEKELEGCGRVLIRKSGTEPVIRILVEADEEEKCRRYAQQIAERMEEGV